MKKIAYKITEWLIEKYDLPFFPKLMKPDINETDFDILNLKAERILFEHEVKYGVRMIQELKSEILECASKHISMKVYDYHDGKYKIEVQLFIAKKKSI